MPNKTKVLTVDDNPTNRRLIEKGLKNNHQVDSADCGKNALNMIRDQDYDVVLLDVNMPEMDGYQVCSAIRNGHRNAKTPVIFISALSSLDDKLKGYSAGAQDYIAKPVIIEELIKKIEVAVSQSKQEENLREQMTLANQTAMTAMNNLSELGVIINVMEKSFEIDCNHELLKVIADSIALYQLNCCVQIRTGDQLIHATSSNPDASRLEKDLLEKAKDADRIVTLGKRAIFNSKRVSILIRNMPIENKEYCGRLIDHLAVIVVAADARCKHIELQEHKLGERNKTLDDVVEIADEEIEKLQKEFIYFRTETRRIMSDLHTEIEESLLDFKLSDAQEDHFYRLLGQGEREMEDLSDWGVVVEESLGRIKTTVTSAIVSMD